MREDNMTDGTTYFGSSLSKGSKFIGFNDWTGWDDLEVEKWSR
jgi:hypothetical protein